MEIKGRCKQVQFALKTYIIMFIHPARLRSIVTEVANQVRFFRLNTDIVKWHKYQKSCTCNHIFDTNPLLFQDLLK